MRNARVCLLVSQSFCFHEGGGKGFPVEPSFGRVLALVNDKEAVCGGNVNVGKMCLKSPDARCNHKIKGAYVKKDTLYVRAAKGQQLTTVFGSYHLSTSNLKTDFVIIWLNWKKMRSRKTQ